ncbi:MAG: hypothetical protein V1797_14200 [Pseudomonadota bacterium]
MAEDDKKLRVEIFLAEYRQRSEETFLYIKSKRKIINYELIALGAVLTGYHYFQEELFYQAGLLLLIPPLLLGFAMLYAYEDFKIVINSKYNNKIRKEIELDMPLGNLLEWEYYFHNEHHKARKNGPIYFVDFGFWFPLVTSILAVILSFVFLDFRKENLLGTVVLIAAIIFDLVCCLFAWRTWCRFTVYWDENHERCWRACKYKEE